MPSRHRSPLVIVLGLLVALIVIAFCLVEQPSLNQRSGSYPAPYPLPYPLQHAINMLSPVSGRLVPQPVVATIAPVGISSEEQATNEAVLVQERERLRRCLGTAPTPSGLAEKLRSEVALREGLQSNDIDIVNEYTYRNPAKMGKRVLASFGDTLSIVLLQRHVVPKTYQGSMLSIFAIDSASDKHEEITSSEVGGWFNVERLPQSWHCPLGPIPPPMSVGFPPPYPVPGAPPPDDTLQSTATAETAALLRRCLEPSPTPSLFQERARYALAVHVGIVPESIELVNEYAYPNPQNDLGQREFPSFGDSVQIIVFQLHVWPTHYRGPGVFFLAIDPQTENVIDMSKSGGDRYWRSPPFEWRCTPEPTQAITPRIITLADMTHEAATVWAPYYTPRAYPVP